MKLIIMILFSYTASATTYYVSNGGSDAANGTSSGTSWQTVAKVNSFSFSAGDQILFKKGDTWNEKLTVPNSGSAGNVITIGSYSTGVKPNITGLKTATMASIGSNLYTSTLSDGVTFQNTIVINGLIARKGRHPNTGWLGYYAGSGTFNRFKTTTLTGTPDYTGADVVVPIYSFVMEVSKIRSQSIDTLNFTPALSYNSNTGDRFFLQNLPAFCDLQNDYAYDSATKLLTVYSTTAPTVQYSSIDTLVNVYKKDYITFDGINFTGANNVSLYVDSSAHNIVQNCTLNFNGGNNFGPTYINGVGGAAIMGRSATYLTVNNDSILNSLNNAVSILYSSDFDSVKNNYIKNTGMFAGMGSGSNGASIGIFVNGRKPYIHNNRIDSVGFHGIQFLTSDTSIIKNNYISNFCANKADGGGIYTYSTGSEGSIIRSNIVVNGLASGGNTSAGIYLDGDSRYITVDSNTVHEGFLQAVLFHYPNHIEFHDNTIKSGIGAPFWYAVGGSGAHFNITRNIFYQTDTTDVSRNATIYNYYGSLFTGSVSDSNYLLRPLKEAGQFRLGVTNTSYDLAGWRTATGYELNSLPTPSGITSAAGVMHINPTLSDSTITFSGLYLDAKGVQRNNSMILKPYQSTILFKSLTELPVAATTTGAKRFGNLIFN